jgi:hypothetical protein
VAQIREVAIADSFALIGGYPACHPSEIETPVDGLIWVGDWHSEPVYWDTDSLPSDPDLSAWARHSEEAGVLPYASLIVTPGEDLGWTCPRLDGWVVREDEQGILICEPAKVSDG